MEGLEMDDILTYAVREADKAAAESKADGCPEKDVRIAWAVALERALIKFVRRNDPPKPFQITPWRALDPATLPRRPTDWYERLHRRA
jgi:hypothetical protein